MSLQFEAADGGFVRWLMVADLRELPTLKDLLAGLRVGPLSRQGYVTTTGTQRPCTLDSS